jgi:hypothetical protein
MEAVEANAFVRDYAGLALQKIREFTGARIPFRFPKIVTGAQKQRWTNIIEGRVEYESLMPDSGAHFDRQRNVILVGDDCSENVLAHETNHAMHSVSADDITANNPATELVAELYPVVGDSLGIKFEQPRSYLSLEGLAEAAVFFGGNGFSKELAIAGKGIAYMQAVAEGFSALARAGSPSNAGSLGERVLNELSIFKEFHRDTSEYYRFWPYLAILEPQWGWMVESHNRLEFPLMVYGQIKNLRAYMQKESGLAGDDVTKKQTAFAKIGEFSAAYSIVLAELVKTYGETARARKAIWNLSADHVYALAWLAIDVHRDELQEKWPGLFVMNSSQIDARYIEPLRARVAEIRTGYGISSVLNNL